jgi:trehalose 6-phosphate phosphatase
MIGRVNEPRTEAGRAGLAAILAVPARALVALDFDGTLAPIVERPELSRPEPGAVEALAALAGRIGAVAVVTGRAADEAVRLGGLDAVPGLRVLGHYGLQTWYDGQLTSPDPLPAVDEARPRLAGLLAAAPDGLYVEDKAHSLVVHTRPAADPVGALAAIRGDVEALGAELGLEVVPGRLVLELRPPGVDKGAALRTLVREHSSGAVCFVGDDLGDVPAYETVEALRADGVAGLTVASVDPALGDAPPELAQRADLVLAGPAAVVAFLRDLAAALAPA